jgi:hypothetical protein
MRIYQESHGSHSSGREVAYNFEENRVVTVWSVVSRAVYSIGPGHRKRVTLLRITPSKIRWYR